MLTADQKKILKVYKNDDPYSQRTHASDALGYLIAREWPVIKEMFSSKMSSRKPLRKDHLFGEVNTHAVTPTRRGGGGSRW